MKRNGEGEDVNIQSEEAESVARFSPSKISSPQGITHTAARHMYDELGELVRGN